MSKNSTRVTAVVGTTMALVIAGTAAVAAAGPRDRDDVRGFGGQRIAGKAGMNDGPGMREMGMRGGLRGMGGGLRGLDADFERTERSVQTADGVTVARVEQGVVDSATDSSLSFTLGSGEAVSVVIDDDTTVAAFEEQEFMNRRGLTRSRMAATPVEAAEIEVGAEVVVWSDAEDDAEFVASRVVIRPAEADETDAEAEAEAAEAEETVSETIEDPAATDA